MTITNSDIRKHLRKGELATDTLESLGYQYDDRKGWSLKEGSQNPSELIEAIRKLIEPPKEAVKTGVEGGPGRGPQWSVVKDLIGGRFRVRYSNIPETSKLREYSYAAHFQGKYFTVHDIRWIEEPHYKGYTVLFYFNLKPHTPALVWLPLSACAFT